MSPRHGPTQTSGRSTRSGDADPQSSETTIRNNALPALAATNKRRPRGRYAPPKRYPPNGESDQRNTEQAGEERSAVRATSRAEDPPGSALRVARSAEPAGRSAEPCSPEPATRRTARDPPHGPEPAARGL